MTDQRAMVRAALALGAAALLALVTFALSSRLGGALAAPDRAWIGELLGTISCVAPALAALYVASREAPGTLGSALLAGAGATGMATVYFLGLSLGTLPLQVLALLLVGRGLGGLIGDRVSHPGHVLPASAIAAAADCASVLSPEGVSNAIVQNDRALSVVALAAPVLGTEALMFVLGVGDLIIIALLLAVARKFDLGGARVALACAAGLVVAFALSAALRAPIPALVPIGIAANVLVPAFAHVPARDRTAALLAIGVAIGLVLWVALR